MLSYIRTVRCTPFRHFIAKYSSNTTESVATKRRELLDSMLRVNQAGEIGANTIYQGQLSVLARHFPASDHRLKLIDEMWDQEKKHLEQLNGLMEKYRTRPSALRPVWEVAGYALGVGTALLGVEAAMACTEAVETVIGEHYNDQLRILIAKSEQDPELNSLCQIIRQLRDDELAHLETAVKNEAHQAPVYPLLTETIKLGCRTAIWIAERV